MYSDLGGHVKECNIEDKVKLKDSFSMHAPHISTQPPQNPINVVMHTLCTLGYVYYMRDTFGNTCMVFCVSYTCTTYE